MLENYDYNLEMHCFSVNHYLSNEPHLHAVLTTPKHRLSPGPAYFTNDLHSFRVKPDWQRRHDLELLLDCKVVKYTLKGIRVGKET
jgi:hypothetical protein